MKKRNNIVSYVVLVVIFVVIITIFILFFSFFSNENKLVYHVNKDSVVFDDNFNYIRLNSEAEIMKKFDGYYYIFDEEGDEKLKYKIGQTAIVYAENVIYIYGNAYEVLSNGDVENVTGETKVLTNGQTRFFKIADRKYLIVSKDIKSVNDNSVNTQNYLIVEIDKQGKAIFANNEINFKAVKLITLRTNIFEFDIANEKLTFANEKIDLKNIIGSTNEYHVVVEEKQDNNDDNSDNDYYDKYLTQVIQSVNNLASGVGQLNEKSETVSVGGNSKYYEISKWIALRSVDKNSSSITLNYYVFDPANEYQAVFFEITDKQGVKKKYYVNKSNTSYTIRDLVSDSEYIVTLCYQILTLNEPVVVDEVVVKTNKSSYSMKIDKIIVANDHNDVEKKYYNIYYTLNIDENYIFEKGYIHFYTDNVLKEEQKVLCTKRKNGCDEIVDVGEKYEGIITLSSLGTENKIVFENVEICNSNGECSLTNLNAYYKFYDE